MSESSQEDKKREALLGLTSEIVAAHVSNNTVGVGDLPDLIERVYRTLASVGPEQDARADRPVPAVPAKQSVTPDYIICLDDDVIPESQLFDAYISAIRRYPNARAWVNYVLFSSMGYKIYTQLEYSALQIFGGLVLGCIKTKFCKKICV